MDFSTATTNYLQTLTAPRRGETLSANTQRAYRFHARRLAAHFGALDLSLVKNGRVEKFVQSLQAESLSPASIVAIYGVLRQILGSVRDADGTRLYAANLKELDPEGSNIPLLKNQKQPCAEPSDVERAIAIDLPVVPFLAASGLRISEALSLEINGSGNSYDTHRSTIHLREKLKIDAAARSVILPSSFAKWFAQFVAASGQLFPQNYQ
jgi:site-specific recombinase XerD